MSRANPFFSVVIPTLNEQRYLPKLLKSLTLQHDRDFEVIVVDGTSEDNTVKVAHTFDNSLPLRVLSSPISNVSVQRNLGAKHANAKTLVFLDADATIPTNFLSQIHHYLLENKHCELLTTWIKPDSKVNSDQLIATLSNIFFEMANSLEKPLLVGYNIIIKKTTFQKIKGFNPSLKIAEDYDLATRLKKQGVEQVILKSPKVTVSFRRFRREGTLSLLRKYALSNIKFFMEGPLTQQLFDYPMGGKVKSNKSKNASTLKKYLKKLSAFTSSTSKTIFQ